MEAQENSLATATANGLSDIEVQITAYYQDYDTAIRSIDSLLSQAQSLEEADKIVDLRERILQQNDLLLNQNEYVKDKKNERISIDRQEIYKIILSASASIVGVAFLVMGLTPGFFLLGLGLASGLGFSPKEVREFLGFTTDES